jgi:endonuclease/exonuclease/phosphatase family metal-dependent hydrolase
MRRRVGRYILIVVVFAAAAAAVRVGLLYRQESDEPGEQGPDPGPFRIATYNINYGNERLGLVVEAIRESKADVVAVQEVPPLAAAFLTGQLEIEYPHTAFEQPEGQYAGKGFGVLSKTPIEQTRFLPPEHGRCGVQIADVKLGGRLLRVVNVHLQPIPVFDARSALDLLKAVREAEGVHRAEIAWIYDAAVDKSSLDPGAAIVILGDFNSMSSFAAPTFLRAHGFTDSFAAVTADADEHPSWEWPTRTGRLRARIDYIWHNGALRTTASRTIHNDSSDHFLVVSELAFNTRAE